MPIPGLPLPKFTWGANTLEFDEPVFSADDSNLAVRSDSAPLSVTNNSTQHVSVFFRNKDIITLKLQLISESKVDEFWDWWEDCQDGRSFNYYPDKDVSFYYTVKITEKMRKFEPDQKGPGLYWVTIELRVI